MNIGPEYLVAVICAVVGYVVVSVILKVIHSPTKGEGEERFQEKTDNGNSDPHSAANATRAPQKWFEVLGVTPAASSEEIKAAYRAKISSYHPDRVASLASEFRQLAEEKSKLINEAYRTATLLNK
jgi:DnaJ-domain-containing protein 1